MANSMIADHHISLPDTKMAEGPSLDDLREQLKPCELAYPNNLTKNYCRVVLLDHLFMLRCRKAMSEQVDTQVAIAVSQLSGVPGDNGQQAGTPCQQSCVQTHCRCNAGRHLCLAGTDDGNSGASGSQALPA